jgi:hypothetical protein
MRAASAFAARIVAPACETTTGWAAALAIVAAMTARATSPTESNRRNITPRSAVDGRR